jgi:tRNA(Ile2) C34 agmatinyltransferase TiaS
MTAIFSRTKALPKCLRCIGGQLTSADDGYGKFECLQCGARYDGNLEPMSRHAVAKEDRRNASTQQSY